MSIDALQEKIRKRKSALIVDMTIYPGQLPVQRDKKQQKSRPANS